MGYPVKQSLDERKSLSAVKISCPAKINLYLNIVGKYPDGFHEIESVVQRISLADELVVKFRKDRDIVFSCDDPALENDDNLCLKAARLFRKRYGLPKGVSLELKKNIPVGAGLGGGSSDAASTLLALDALCRSRFSLRQLYSLGAALGSDVNFFLARVPCALIKGRGEQVLALNSPGRFFYRIIYPRERLSTAAVYKATNAKLTNFLNNVNIISYALQRRDYELFKWNMFNVLEKGAFLASRCLYRYREGLKDKGFTMTGSGSAFFKVMTGVKEKSSLSDDDIPKNWKVFQARSI